MTWTAQRFSRIKMNRAQQGCFFKDILRIEKWFKTLIQIEMQYSSTDIFNTLLKLPKYYMMHSMNKSM